MVNSYGLKDSNLFKPLKVGDITLSTRIALAPLTRGRNDDEFVPSDLTTIYYDQRSKRSGTLIITEAILISLISSGQYQPPGIFTSKQFTQWSKIIEAVHKNKSFIFLQLWALGGMADAGRLKAKGLKFLAPSDDVYINEEQEQQAKEAENPSHGLTIPEIKSYINDYVVAAKKSIELGADGIELHGANGYLMFQFLYTSLNKRTDQYGGSIENRARFVLEVIDAVGEAIGYSKVGYRLSPYWRFESWVSGGKTEFFEPSTIAVYSYILSELEERRRQGKELAYIHIVEPRVTDISENNEWIFQIYKGVIIRASGYAENPEKAKADADSYDKTVLAYGRHFISNPDLINRLENDWPLNDYDRNTFYTPGPEGFIDYPEFNQN